jgi:hypothetical protein
MTRFEMSSPTQIFNYFSMLKMGYERLSYYYTSCSTETWYRFSYKYGSYGGGRM